MADMHSIILHHYPTSPFAEKIRLIMGAKGMHWSSVLIPAVMPKPDVVALTGGYRKTPILQIGADIFCDTALIAEVIEAHAPHPSLYPRGAAGAARIVAQWADSTLFWAAVTHALQAAGAAHMFEGMPPEAIKAFAEDRKLYRANLPRIRGPEARAALELYLGWLEEMIGGQGFLLGARPCVADFSVYHCLWFISRSGPQAKILAPYRQLAAWRERMRAFGHGTHERLDSGAAIALAHSASPLASRGMGGEVHGFAAGDKVVIAATDTGIDPIEGELYAATPDRISIARNDARAGRVVVHFPRLGFELRRLD